MPVSGGEAVKLAASLVVRNELGRYLEPCIGHLLEFCDIVAIRDDGSTDGFPAASAAYRSDSRVHVQLPTLEPQFFKHEGATRQGLLDFTLSMGPTHVLAIDADEFVTDGAALRRACEAGHRVVKLEMIEVWEASPGHLCVRVDGGWRPHGVHAVWAVPGRMDGRWRIADRALACGRVPMAVDRAHAAPCAAEILHFGWANESERVARHARYVTHDGGRFHRSAHLDSILAPCSGVELERMGWPDGLSGWRDAILAKVTSTVSPAA